MHVFYLEELSNHPDPSTPPMVIILFWLLESTWKIRLKLFASCSRQLVVNWTLITDLTFSSGDFFKKGLNIRLNVESKSKDDRDIGNIPDGIWWCLK